MELIARVWDQFEKLKLSFFKWRMVTSIINKFLLAIAFAALTGLLAQAKIYLPWTPVPITGQTMAVLMSGVILGSVWGGISQIIYVSLGVLGVPWFASGKFGLSALVGPTGGYLVGFVVASFFMGHVLDKHLLKKSSGNFWKIIGFLLFANFAIIYGFGLTGLGSWMSLAKGSSVSFWGLLKMGLLPFIVGDLLKLGFVSMVTLISLPHTND